MSTAVSVIRELPLSLGMRDGVRLAGEVWLPAGDGPFPTLLRKTPYERRARDAADRWFVDHGYAVAVVSQRGRHGSGGTFYQFRNEAVDHLDGYDTIEAIAAQPWSEGMVGTYGVSSDGQWQLSAATLQPPHLAAMFVSYAANPRAARVDQGAYLGTVPAWSSKFDGLARRLDTREDWAAWLAGWQRSKLPLIASFIAPEVIDGFEHLADDAYWLETDPANAFDRVQVPVHHECGWYDRYVTATFRNFELLRRTAATEVARTSQRVIVGPWLHGGRVPDSSTVAFGPQAAGDRLQLQLDWFDHWLRGRDTGVLDHPPVRLYEVGSDSWMGLDEWPRAGSSTWRLHLGARTSLGVHARNLSLNGGTLVDTGPTEAGIDHYVHDPYDPIPTIGGHGGVGWQWEAGPADQRPAEQRSLTYTSEPLDHDVHLLGEPIAQLFVTCDRPDTDYVVTISDVYPDGTSALLRQNAMRAEWRDGLRSAPRPMVPGEPTAIAVRLDGIAAVLRAGHRLRVAIASSSFPGYLPNPGTGGLMHLAREGVVAHNGVCHGGETDSYVDLPLA